MFIISADLFHLSICSATERFFFCTLIFPVFYMPYTQTYIIQVMPDLLPVQAQFNLEKQLSWSVIFWQADYLVGHFMENFRTGSALLRLSGLFFLSNWKLFDATKHFYCLNFQLAVNNFNHWLQPSSQWLLFCFKNYFEHFELKLWLSLSNHYNSSSSQWHEVCFPKLLGIFEC